MVRWRKSVLLEKEAQKLSSFSCEKKRETNTYNTQHSTAQHRPNFGKAGERAAQQGKSSVDPTIRPSLTQSQPNAHLHFLMGEEQLGLTYPKKIRWASQGRLSRLSQLAAWPPGSELGRGDLALELVPPEAQVVIIKQLLMSPACGLASLLR